MSRKLCRSWYSPVIWRSTTGAIPSQKKAGLHGAATEDSIAYPVLQRAKAAVEAHNLEMHRAGRIRADIIEHGPNEISTVMTLSDGTADLMRLELAVPNRKQAQRLAYVFQTRADAIYAKVLARSFGGTGRSPCEFIAICPLC